MNDPPFKEYNHHLFEAARLAAQHFSDVPGATIHGYAGQKADQFEALIKLFINVEKREAICPLEDIKFRAYRVNMQIDDWD